MNEMVYSFYENAILSCKRGCHNGTPINAKPLYYITLIDLIGKGEVQNNKIFFCSKLQVAYLATSKHFMPDLKPTQLFKPFYYSKSELFYHLQEKKSLEAKSLSNLHILKNVDYAYLDNALWDLLQDAESRKRLREAIVRHFFNETKEQESPMAAEASIAYREDEATPRQLNYIKRATGNDYRCQGLTKRQASKMIRELIDDDEGKKAAEPAFKPGSLEEILSMCSTREEQLEAARKFFGENK